MKVFVQWRVYPDHQAVTNFSKDMAYKHHKLTFLFIACAALSFVSLLLLFSGAAGEDTWFGVGFILFTIILGVYVFRIFPGRVNREIEEMLLRDLNSRKEGRFPPTPNKKNDEIT